MSKDIKFDIKDIPRLAKPGLDFLKRYKIMIFSLVVLGACGFLVFRINVLTRAEPDEAAVTEKLQGAPRPKIDQSAVQKLQDLEDQNVQVQTLFQQARDNPFSE